MKRLLSCIALPRACTTVIQAKTRHSTPLWPVQVTNITHITHITHITQTSAKATWMPARGQSTGSISAMRRRNLTTGVSRRVSG